MKAYQGLARNFLILSNRTHAKSSLPSLEILFRSLLSVLKTDQEVLKPGE